MLIPKYVPRAQQVDVMVPEQVESLYGISYILYVTSTWVFFLLWEVRIQRASKRNNEKKSCQLTSNFNGAESVNCVYNKSQNIDYNLWNNNNSDSLIKKEPQSFFLGDLWWAHWTLTHRILLNQYIKYIYRLTWVTSKCLLKAQANILYYGGFHFPSAIMSSTIIRRLQRCGKRKHSLDVVHDSKLINAKLTLYRKIPLKTLSRWWGLVNQLELPSWLRVPAIRLYIWMFSCSLHEANVQDLRAYKNLSEFFRRQLRPGLRPIDGGHSLTSPVDGTILYQGRVDNGILEQVKGVNYSLQGFLDPQLVNNKNVCSDMEYAKTLIRHSCNELLYSIIYLAPGDYHRFHSPTNWTVTQRRHFPGELFSVNPGVARWLQGLFNMNERAVYSGKWQYGFFSLTAVGATNVGSIHCVFDKTLKTNSTGHKPGTCFNADFLMCNKSGISIKKGELFGDFNLGSTIVLIFEAPKNFKFSSKIGRKIKYGQPLGKAMPRNRKKHKRH